MIRLYKDYIKMKREIYQLLSRFFPIEIVHMIYHMKREAEMNDIKNEIADMRSMWNYAYYPYIHASQLRFMSVVQSLAILQDREFWMCILMGRDQRIIRRRFAPHIFYDPDDPLYRDENGKTLFAVKPWQEPLRKISAKIDLYNRHRGFVECVWAEKHDFPGIPINIQFIPVWDYHDDGIHQVIRWELYD